MVVVLITPATTTRARIPQVLLAQKLQQQATSKARSQQRAKQVQQIRPEHFDFSQYPFTDANEKHWRNILWTTAVVEPQQPFVATALEQILGKMTNAGLSEAQVRLVDMSTQVGHQLLLSRPDLYQALRLRFEQAVERSADPDWVATSLATLAKTGLGGEALLQRIAQVKTRFPQWQNHPALYSTLRDLEESLKVVPLPPLGDLLSWQIAPNQPHLYVICHPDRRHLCQALLKDGRGEFVQANGRLWTMALLLRSIHGLGWNFFRGQTPQGVYRIEGALDQENGEFFRAYGQFPLVNLFVPFEPDVKSFVANRPGSTLTNLADYQALLPPSWRQYWPMQQTFWAGKTGRSLFRIHGSGDAPDFFSGKQGDATSYSWNPTIGCLSALELYNEQGELLKADMPKILDTLEKVGGKSFTGYLVVVDVPAPPGQPMALVDLEAVLRAHQAKQPRKR
jgi:hypothetical protein